MGGIFQNGNILSGRLRRNHCTAWLFRTSRGQLQARCPGVLHRKQECPSFDRGWAMMEQCDQVHRTDDI